MNNKTEQIEINRNFHLTSRFFVGITRQRKVGGDGAQAPLPGF
jgi:hypothetical protein